MHHSIQKNALHDVQARRTPQKRVSRNNDNRNIKKTKNTTIKSV